uniref:LysE/ArgO family amino acid transporter n=1 Tax=Candidatus Planktophila dulcis TaxID=1884914 RepID=UPI003CF0D598
MIALITGFFTGLSLIVAIGAQNAFVIKQGLLRSHVTLVVFVCAISDALLIIVGTGGLGRIIQSKPDLLNIIRWFGVIYLTWFGIKSVRAAFRNETLTASDKSAESWKKVLVTVLAMTYLNPHVYLDTVIFVGSLANQFESQRWYFALGACIASGVWFSAIGYGARSAAHLMSKPIFWRILESVIAAIMFTLAITLAFYKFS